MYHTEIAKLKEEPRKHALHDLFNPIPEIPGGLFQRALDRIEDLERYVKVLEDEVGDLEDEIGDLEEEIGD